MNKIIIDEISNCLSKKDKIIIAIDGKSASGKTTLANKLLEFFDCNVFHIDDFYVPFEMRTDDRMMNIGGNIHFERFTEEVINNLKSNKAFEYGVFSCTDGKVNHYVSVEPKKINIIEGVYCMHPCIRNIYDLKILLTISEEEQHKRLKQRNPEKLDQFIRQWIPRENMYFNSINVDESYDLILDINSI